MKSNVRAFRFAAILCAITVIGNLVGMFATGSSDVAILPFLCFLPMAFWFVDHTMQQTREYIEKLESRIRELESHDGAA